MEAVMKEEKLKAGLSEANLGETDCREGERVPIYEGVEPPPSKL